MTDKTRGGTRQGSGRKKSEIETTLINFRIPKADKESLKAKYGKDLNRMFKEWLKSL